MGLRAVILLWLLTCCASPVIAQQNSVHTVAFDDFAFSFDATVATHVYIVQASSSSPEIHRPRVKHTAFLLYHDDLDPSVSYDTVGEVRVYRTADFADYGRHRSRLEQLHVLLAERPDWPHLAEDDYLSRENELPFLPVYGAVQVIWVRRQYVDTEAVRGISYLTVFRQDAAPFVADDFLYTFQGISHDGAYYVSVIFKLTTPLYPEAYGNDYDYWDFSDNLPAYYAENAAQLDASSADAFIPSLTLLDAVVESLTFVDRAG